MFLDYTLSITKLFDYKSSVSFLAIYPELFLIFSLSIVIAFLVIFDYNFNYKFILIKLSANVLIFILLLMLILLNNNHSDFLIFDSLLINDYFSIFIRNVLIVALIGCIYISYNYIFLEKIVQYEYFILLGLSFLGMFTMVTSNDLITMYLGVELQSLAFYVLAAFKIYSNFSTEAGLKYFILGAFSSGLLLFGCTLIYGFTGTTNFIDLQALFINNDLPYNIFNGVLLGTIFITISILFKLGAAPFHMWLPDVYEGVPTTVTAIFSIVPKIAIFSLFLRLSFNIFNSNFFFWNQIIVCSSIISIIIGTLGALYQVKIKKLIAYSAISHVGFLLIGFSSLSSLSVFALFFYIIVYIFISLNIFSVLLSLRKIDNNLKLKKINEFIVLFKSNKLLSINFAIIMFSIAGIPPLIGFYSKFYIFLTAIKSNIYLVAIIAAIFSVIASMYYIRLIKLMFFRIYEYWAFLGEISKSNSLIISGTFFFNIFFFC